MKYWKALSVILTIVLFSAACASLKPAATPAASGQPGQAVPVDGGGSYQDISVAQLQAMLKQKDFLFVNVHTPFAGNIPNTDLSIPFDQITQHLDQLPTDKNAKIVLYCRSDRMSNIAARDLVKQGYTNVWNLVGGFDAWASAGLPLQK